MKDVAEGEGAIVTIEPLKSLPVQRDLMVDYKGFFDSYRAVKPFLIAGKVVEQGENVQMPAEWRHFEDLIKCILCGSCQSSCPVVADEEVGFLGPAAVAQAGRFVFDSRDEGLEPRLDVLDGPDGVWPCENHYNCTKVCPRGIKITKSINLIKRAIKASKEQRNQDT